MEMEESDETQIQLQQLLSMGFSQDLASQALFSTGGNSALKATEWILTNTTTPHSPNPNPNPNSPNPNPSQAKIDRFFHFPTKPSKPQPPQKQENSHSLSQSQSLPMKRQREEQKQDQTLHHKPLSERMRPRSIDDIVGQDHLLADKSSLLRSAIESNRLPSLLFWGPPGTGKTSIARAISSTIDSNYHFISLSAVTCGVKDVRDAVDQARKSNVSSKLNKNMKQRRTVLFVDEVHRFNKSQQDSFLPVIEDGSIVFMGATTENPSFHLITPLLSRCRVLTLNPLQPHHVAALLRRAAADSEKGLAQSVVVPPGFDGTEVKVNEDVIKFLSVNCDGDARVALNALEISSITAAAAAGTIIGLVYFRRINRQFDSDYSLPLSSSSIMF